MQTLSNEQLFKPIPGNVPVKVADSLQTPYVYVGILHITFPNGEQYYGSASVIAQPGQTSSVYVLTCAHNLYDAGDGGKAASVTFVQAYNGSGHQPYAANSAVDWFYPEQYPGMAISRNVDHSLLGSDLLAENINLDYGVVKLSRPIHLGYTPVPQLVVKTTDELTDLPVQINGYGYFEEEMSHATGSIRQVTAMGLTYPISTSAGAAGSPIMATDNQSIVGIHTRSTNENFNQGIRITQEVANTIKSWMK